MRWLLVVCVRADDWLRRVRQELPALEARRIHEGAVTGMSHGALVDASAAPAELLLAHAKLKCYFDDADAAEKSYALSAQLNPDVAATWHGLGRVRLGRGSSLDAADAFGRAAALDDALLPRLFRATALRLSESCDAPLRTTACRVVDAILAKLKVRDPALCDSLLDARTAKNASTLQLAGYAVVDNVMSDNVHASLLVPWYKHVFGLARARHDALVAAGTSGLDIETLELDDGSSFVIHGRWHAKTRRVELWGEPLADILNHALTPLVEAASALAAGSLVPTYPWPVHYGRDGRIDIHLDQSDNELSLSYQVRAFRRRSQRQQQGAVQWPLYFVDTGLQLRPGEDGPGELPLQADVVQRAPPVALRNNDGVLYRGRDVAHWRPPQSTGVELYQLVFAWRRIDDRACHGSL